MPDSSGTIEEISNSLKASLQRGKDGLDANVVAGSKKILLQNIAFVPASDVYSMHRESLKSKYIVLNPGACIKQQSPHPNAQSSPAKAMAGSTGNDKNGESLPLPRVILFPEEKVRMEWNRVCRIGAGLVNMGNTCFFNSTLQCLTYTAPLANYIFTNDHREKCRKSDFCMMCTIQSHIKTSLDCSGRSIKPHCILQKLRCIAKHMKWGRQEDAHEFLRFVIDHLHQSCLNGETKNLDKISKDTTVVNQIFGGYLRSQVTCLQCHAKSNTFDPFMDLSLDIKGVGTVEDALHKFVKPEVLDNENAYKCTKCKNKVKAQKRFSIQKAPNILTIQLNRFDFNRHLSGKINKFIKYPERIDLRNFMSQKQGEPVLYHLYGVLVHSGHSSDHGHYYSFVKSPSKTWYCMNDSLVNQASHSSVLSADAYVLFYARIKTSTSSSTAPNPHSILNNVKTPSSPTKSFIGPMMPKHLKQENVPMTNGFHGVSSSEVGTPIPRTPTKFSNSAMSGPKIIPHGTPASSLPGAPNKISFPILTPQQRKQQIQKQIQQNEDGKRIVLQIKHGNSTTMEKSPDGKSKVVNGKPVHSHKLGLVPYNDDSDSEQENHAVHGRKISLLPTRTLFSENKAAHTVNSKQPIGSNHALSSNSSKHDSSNSQDNSASKDWPAVTVDATGDASATRSSLTSNWLTDLQSPKTNVLKRNDIDTASKPEVSKTENKLKDKNSHNTYLSENPVAHRHSEKETPFTKEALQQSKHANINGKSNSGDKWHTTPVDISDKQPLLNSPSSSHTSESSRYKKQKKKHKKERVSCKNYQELREDSESPHRKKKRKHKEKKKKKRRYSSSESDSDSSVSKRKKHKQKKYSKEESSSDSEHEKERQRKRQDSSDSKDYEWVVKTLDNHTDKPKKTSATVQKWDHHVKDDVAPRKDDQDRVKSSWDGSRANKIGDYLEKSSHCLGGNVLSWDGSMNHVDRELELDKSSRKRRWADKYNEDIDAGKVKKIRNNNMDSNFSFTNAFQDFVNSRPQDKNEYRRFGTSWPQDHSYHQRPAQKHKQSRHNQS